MENVGCKEKRRSSILKPARSPTRNPLTECNGDNQLEEKRKSLGKRRVSFAEKHQITEFDIETSKDMEGSHEALPPINPSSMLPNACISFGGHQDDFQQLEYKENSPVLNSHLLNTTMATRYFNESMLCDIIDDKIEEVEPKTNQQNQHNITDNLLKDMSLTLTMSTLAPILCDPPYVAENDVPIYCKPASVPDHVMPIFNNTASVADNMPVFGESDPLKEKHLPIFSESDPLKEKHLPIFCEPPPVEENLMPIFCEPAPVKDNLNLIFCEPAPVKDNLNPIFCDPAPVKDNPIFCEPGPVKGNLNPIFSEPAPVKDNLIPNFCQPAPVKDKQMPIFCEPTPVKENRMLVFCEPAPVKGNRMPVSCEPAPVKDNQMPVSCEPAPVKDNRMPAFCEPASVATNVKAILCNPSSSASRFTPVTVEGPHIESCGFAHESVEVTRLEPSEISSFLIPVNELSDMVLSRTEDKKIEMNLNPAKFHQPTNCNPGVFDYATPKDNLTADSSTFVFSALRPLELPQIAGNVEAAFCSVADLELSNSPLDGHSICVSASSVFKVAHSVEMDEHNTGDKVQKQIDSDKVLTVVCPLERDESIALAKTVYLNESMEIDNFVKADKNGAAAAASQLRTQNSINEEESIADFYKQNLAALALETDTVLPGLEEEIKKRLESDLVVEDWAYEVERLSLGLVHFTFGYHAFHLSVTFEDFRKDEDPSFGRRMHNIKVVTSYPDAEFPEYVVGRKMLNCHMNLDFEGYKHSAALPELLEKLTDPFFRYRTLMKDAYMLRAYLACPISYTADGAEVQVRLVSTRVMVIIFITFTIKFDTYPFAAIRPHFTLKSPEGSELRTCMMEAMMQEKTGEMYLWRMFVAARSVLRLREKNVTSEELKSLHSALFLKHIKAHH